MKIIYQIAFLIVFLFQNVNLSAQDCNNLQISDPLFGFIPDSESCCVSGGYTICYDFSEQDTVINTTPYSLNLFEHPNGTWTGDEQFYEYSEIANILNDIGNANGLNVNFQWNATEQTICSSTSSLDFGDIGYGYSDVGSILISPTFTGDAPCPIVEEPDAEQLLGNLMNNASPMPMQMFPGTFENNPINISTADVSNGGEPSNHVDPDDGTITEYTGPTANQAGLLLNSALSGFQSGAGCFNYNCVDLSAMLDLFLSDPDNVTAINDAWDESGEDVPEGLSLSEYLSANSGEFLGNVSLGDLVGESINVEFPDLPCPEGQEIPDPDPFTNPKDPNSEAAAKVTTTATPKTDADQDYFSSTIAGLGVAGSGSTPPSPSAMQTIQSIKGGVNLYNGSQNSSIPLYSLQANDISLPISISSSNNGLKVDDLGSLVGQNWNLNAGGSISRVVKGLPDEFVGDIISQGVGQIHKINGRFEPFSNAGIELKITGASQFGCSLIKIKKVIKDIGFEKKLSGSSPVKVTWSWTPLRANLVNFTIGFPIKTPLPWLTIYVQTGFNVGIVLNKGFGDIAFEEEAQGFLSIDNGQLGIPQLPAAGALIYAMSNNNDKIDMLERVNGNRGIDDLTFFNDQFGQYSNWLNAIEDLTQGHPTYNSQKVDSEPDEFYFNFGNYSGKFSFNPDESIVMFPHFEGLEITPFFVNTSNNNANRIIKGFTVNTPEGMYYEFGDISNNVLSFRAVDKTESEDYYLPNFYTYPELKVGGKGTRDRFGKAQIDVAQLRFSPHMGEDILLSYGSTYERNYKITNSPEFTSAWHLVKVKSHLTQETVDFTYDRRDLKYYGGKSFSHTFPNFGNGTQDQTPYLKTKANTDLNPRLLYNGQPTRWKNGQANFSYSVSDIELSRWHLIDIQTNRGESIHFSYNCDRGEIVNDKVCSRIEVRRGGIGESESNPIYKGWQLIYESKETASSSMNCDFEPTTDPIPPAVSIGGETTFNLGEKYSLNWTELDNAKYFFLNFRIACFVVPLRFVTPYNDGHIDFGHRTHLSEFGSLMDVKLLNDYYQGSNSVELGKEEAIFNAERKRTFLREIKELGKNTASGSDECSTDGYPLLTIDYKGNIDILPKRFSVHQDRFGYHIDNSVSGSPFPKIEYLAINGTNFTSSSSSAKLQFGFFNEAASGEIQEGQADFSALDPADHGLAQVGAIDQINFASGGYIKYNYEVNDLPEEGFGAGIRVSQLIEDPLDSPAKTTNYFYEEPTVVLEMDRISQNQYNYYYRHPENGFSYEDFYEEKVRTTSSPQNEMYSNKSNYVGYFKVTEQWDDIGRIVHYFTTPVECSLGGGGGTGGTGGGTLHEEDTSTNRKASTQNATSSTGEVEDCKNIKFSSYEQIKKRRVYLGNYDVQSQDYEEEVPSLRFPKIGYKSWRLGIEYLTEVYNDDNALKQKTENEYLEYKSENPKTLNYFKSVVYQHNFQGTFWQAYVSRILSNYKPFGEKINEEGNETTDGALDDLLNILVSLIKGTLVNHAYKEIELNYMVSDRKLSTGNMRPITSTTTNYFSSGGNISSNTYVYGGSPYLHIPKRVISTVGNQSTYIENIFRTDLTEVELNEFDQATLDYLEGLNYAPPIAIRSYLKNPSTGAYNLVKRDFTVLTIDPDNPSITRIVPKANYTFLGEDPNVSPLLVGEFSNYNEDGKPQTYRLAKHDGTFFDDISLTLNEQLQLLTRTYIGFTTSNSYNLYFELETTSDPNDVESYFGYDDRGRLAEAITQVTPDAPEGRQIFAYSYTIEPGNNSTTVQTTFVDESFPDQGITSKTDGFGKPLKAIRTADGAVLSSAEYDIFFRGISSYSIGNGTTQIEHEASPLSQTTTTTDAVENITKSKIVGGGTFFTNNIVTDPNGHISHSFTDGLGRTRRTIGGVGAINSTTEYEYDPWGRLSQIINSEGENYTYGYNEIGQLSNKTMPGASGQSRVIWDIAYRPKALQDGNGNTQVMTYDEYNRLLEISDANGINFGNLENLVVEDAFAGNETDLLLSNVYHVESGNDRSWLSSTEERILTSGGVGEFKVTENMSFDNIGRPASINQTYPDGVVSSTPEYSDAGIIRSVINSVAKPGSEINFNYQFTFDNVLRPLETSLGVNGAANHILTKLAYNGIDQVTSKFLGGTGTYTSDPDQYLQKIDYLYDAAGKLTYINTPIESECFQNQEFCFLETTLVIEQSPFEPCATITGIKIIGVAHSFPSNVNLFDLNNASQLQNYIADILDDLGYFGEVEVSVSQPTSGPNKNKLVYYIQINNVNVTEISLISTSSCKTKLGFATVSCCEPGNSDPGDSSPTGFTVNNDLYYQHNTYSGIDISRIELASDCISGKIRNNYSYDALHRISNQANTIFQMSGEIVNDRYSTTYNYDEVGNITKMTREGWISQNTEFGTIDVLEYTYDLMGGNPSTLLSIKDLAEQEDGFRHNPDALPTAEYSYDGNGNLINDPFKELAIDYNRLNLPRLVSGDGTLKFAYTIGGEKIKKTTSENGIETDRFYLGGVEFLDTPQFYSHGDGRIVFDEEEIHYQYKIADHLGNTVVLFEDLVQDGEIVTEGSTTDPIEVLQRNLYYPFGLVLWNAVGIQETDPEMNYLYNGKELESDLGLDMHFYGFRMYDAAIGRFPSVDPIADHFAFVSPFNYAENSPVRYIDLWGLQKAEKEDDLDSYTSLPEAVVTPETIDWKENTEKDRDGHKTDFGSWASYNSYDRPEMRYNEVTSRSTTTMNHSFTANVIENHNALAQSNLSLIKSGTTIGLSSLATLIGKHPAIGPITAGTLTALFTQLDLHEILYDPGDILSIQTSTETVRSTTYNDQHGITGYEGGNGLRFKLTISVSSPDGRIKGSPLSTSTFYNLDPNKHVSDNKLMQSFESSSSNSVSNFPNSTGFGLSIYLRRTR